jgi:methionyl-tRNA formyltransferase
VLARKVRAFSPFPGTQVQYDKQMLKVSAARAVALAHGKPAGTLLSADASGVRVAAVKGHWTYWNCRNRAANAYRQVIS